MSAIKVLTVRMNQEQNPFESKTEEAFFASIDIGIAVADAGQLQDADEAIFTANRASKIPQIM